MKDWFDLFQILLSMLKNPSTAWVVVLFLLWYIFRDRLKLFTDGVLNWIGVKFGGEMSFRRFEPTYRRCVRESHLYMQLVGIRTEGEQRPKITEAYVPIKLLPRGSGSGEALLIEEVILKYTHSLILGDPGAGKSTLLDFLTIKFSDLPKSPQHHFSFLSYLMFLNTRAMYPCPIYVHLRGCLPKNESLLDDILDPATHILPDVLPLAIRRRMPRQFIERCFKRKQALLLLDGLDEVADEQMYKSVTRKINDFIKTYPNTKVVVTCRKAGWKSGLDQIFQILSVLSLDSQQQYEFIHKWYTAILEHPSSEMRLIGSNISEHIERETNQLFSIVKIRDRLRELANNPMMLSLVCLVHRQRRDLPRGRAALYQNCLQILLEVWDRRDKDLNQSSPSTEEKEVFLQRVAYHMHCERLKEISRQELENLVVRFIPSFDSKIAHDLVKQIEVRSGLIVERAIDKLAFSHLTFQEFLVVEYLRKEEDGNIDIKTIKTTSEWSAWREPILLMCGIMRNPTLFVTQLYAIRPLLALYGLAEIDPVKLDISSAMQLITSVMKEVNCGSIPLDEALPAFIDLLSIERNPFGHEIVDFIYKRTNWINENQVSKLVEVLCKKPTREVAKIILNLLSEYNLESRDHLLISGLATIGDPAIEEALEWVERKRLSEDQLFQLLIESVCPLATKALWLKYKLQPPRSEMLWAQSWALRLSSPENDRVVRSLVCNGPGVRDSIVWPYRQNDKSALAAIVKGVVEVLCKHYSAALYTGGELVNEFAQFDLRIQIPLLLALKDKVTPPWIKKIPGGSEIDLRAWYAVIAQQTNKAPRGFLRTVLMYLGFGVEFISIFLATLGIKALWLPNVGLSNIELPNVTPSNFWDVLPGSVQAIFATIIFMSIIAFLYLTIGSSENFFSKNLAEGCFSKGCLTILAGFILAIIFPLGIGYYFIWSHDGTKIESLLITNRTSWVAGVYTLALCLACSVFSFFALKNWIRVDPIFFITLTTIVFLLGILFQLGPRSFQNKSLIYWLQKHHLGYIVLDEFVRE